MWTAEALAAVKAKAAENQRRRAEAAGARALRAAAEERALVVVRAERIMGKVKKKWKAPSGVPARALARATQAAVELTAGAVVEQLARGALFDPRTLFYDEDGAEHYTTDGPLREDALGNWAPAWKAGEVKRVWQTGDLKPMHELTEAQAQSITSIEVVMKNAVAGDGQVDRVLKIRLAPREKYVELAARHHGMLLDRTETNVNVTVVGAKLDEARQTWAKLQTLEATALPEPEGT